MGGDYVKDDERNTHDLDCWDRLGLVRSLWPVPAGSWIYSNWFDNDSFSVFRGCTTASCYLADQEKVKAFLRDRSSYLPLLLFAFLGLLMTQLTYLEAIDATNAGTATVFQYLCPIGVLAYSCVKDRVAPTVSEIFSMVLAIAGTFLIATHGQLNQLAITPKGLVWGLVSAFAYALYIILPIQLIQKWGSMLVIGVGMLIPGLVMIPFTGRRLFHGQYSMDNLMGLVGLVVIGTIFAYTVFLKGTTLIGPVKGSLLAAIEPISAVFFAFAIMNEHFFAIDFIGMAMILLAVLLISLKDLMIQKEKGIL